MIILHHEDSPIVDVMTHESLRNYIHSAADQLYWATHPQQEVLLFHQEEGSLIPFSTVFFLFSIDLGMLNYLGPCKLVFHLLGASFCHY